MSSSCRCSASTPSAPGSAMAAAITTGPWRRLARRRDSSALPLRRRNCRACRGQRTIGRSIRSSPSVACGISLPPKPLRDSTVKLLFLGDVVGRAGRDAISTRVPELIARYGFDCVVINGENASHGRGLTEQHFEGLRAAGADVVTLGDHAFDQRDTLTYIERAPALLRPINMPPGTPGRGATLIETRSGHRVLVINALGRVFMGPADDPFRAVEAAVAACPLGEQADAIVVDFHTEATSEIQGMGHFLDGRVSLVVGTHTHIPTADARVLKGGTALMAD